MRKCTKHFFLCVSFRSSVIMTHTLTGFMELMDHGIVSWENLSSVFIKKVLYLPLSVRLLVCYIYFFFPPTVAAPSLTIPTFLPLPLSDCQLCQRQADRCVNTAGVPGHPGEHGAEQPQPLHAGQTGSHYGEAHRSPPGVSNR